jgi:hypothetical protein
MFSFRQSSTCCYRLLPILVHESRQWSPQGYFLRAYITLIIFINYIDYVCCGNTKLILFADDAQLYSGVNMDSVSVSPQQSLVNLCPWANAWQLAINISECAALSACSKPEHSVRTNNINGIEVTHHNFYIDLAIHYSQNISFVICIVTTLSQSPRCDNDSARFSEVLPLVTVILCVKHLLCTYGLLLDTILLFEALTSYILLTLLKAYNEIF